MERTDATALDRSSIVNVLTFLDAGQYDPVRSKEWITGVAPAESWRYRWDATLDGPAKCLAVAVKRHVDFVLFELLGQIVTWFRWNMQLFNNKFRIAHLKMLALRA